MTTPAQQHPGSVAIIGMAARLPGSDRVDRFWHDLREGVERVVEHTREEMLARGASEQQVDDEYWVNASAPLADAESFDAAFFGYSAREAAAMDPQHRIFLECAHHGLEDAGYDPTRFPGLIGVYAGATMNTYVHYNLMANADVASVIGDLQTMIGNDKDYLATRVSYKLDLRGPSMAVQTACSSSLVAVHMACRALLDDECDIALAGGTSLRMPHGAGYLANPGGTSARDGHCRAFDEAAAGSVTGSGAGVVVLKKLDAALRDGDTVHAVIRGTAVGNDGGTKASFTAPSIEGQARTMARAIRRAGLSARDIDYVEAHGTGTPLGDPIEVAALTKAFRATTDDVGYCLLGSVKPNIGHLDAAAGIAGVIKAVLVLKNRKVPPVVNFTRPNPKLELDRSPFAVPVELTPLDSDRPLRAAVNSLGMGGTNAFTVLEEAPRARPGGPSRRRQPVLLSARDPQALDELGAALGQWTRENPHRDLADVARTLATGRRAFEHRRACVATDLEDAGYAIGAGGGSRLVTGQVASAAHVGLLFPGQGAQRVGMGLRAAGGDPRLAAHLEHCLTLFGDLAGLDLRALLAPEDGDSPRAREELARTEHTQPALFAVEWALGRTLLDYGLKPRGLLGHSVGEWVAATLAGVFSLEDAVELVALRGRLLADTPEGAMLYADLPEREVRALLPDDLAVAAVNAERLTVVSGAPGPVAAFADLLAARGDVTTGSLRVTRAFHSPLVAGAADELRAAVAGRARSAPAIPVVSNVTGKPLTAEQAVDPDYWREQLLSPVRYADGVAALRALGADVLLETGPGKGLTGLRPPAEQADSLPVLVGARESEPPDLLDVLVACWARGVDVDWAACYDGERRARVPLPLYPFRKDRHWLDPRPAATTASGAPAEAQAQPRLEAERWPHRPAWLSHTPLPAGPVTALEGLPEGGVLPGGPDEPVAVVLRHERGADAEAALGRLLDTARALTAPGGRRVALVVVTEGCADPAPGRSLTDPAAAALASALRVVGQEHPGLRPCLVDGSDVDTATAAALAWRFAPGSVLAARPGVVWESVFVPGPAPADATPPTRWLVLGGSGAFGRAFAEAALAGGAERVLALDTAPRPGPADHDGRWAVVRGDAADPAAVAAALAELGPGAGVAHAVGLPGETGFAPVADLTAAQLAAHLAAKRGPADAVAAVAAGHGVREVLLVSSLAAALGGLGGFGYAAANGWLDALAQDRDDPEGTRWRAVAWEHWQDEQPDPRDPRTRHALVGKELRASAEVVLARAPEPALALSTADLATRAARLRAAAAAAPKPVRREQAAPGRAPARAAMTPMQRVVARTWSELLGIEDFGVHDNFLELGGSSLGFMQTVTKLRRVFGRELSMVELFETPTVAALATHLEGLGLVASDAGADGAPGETAPAGPPAAAAVTAAPAASAPVTAAPAAEAPAPADGDALLVDRIQAMSDDEVLALLARYEGKGE
ncbi:acyltransferase domain-containing protein [Actinosynnema pretiosum subsp. pretiosum]|uniref:Acyltransferase domain-containing protein n=1 Tax=Actinosynnema pretiosum subsp. pretiosum TaxID=103721 RepID=A0AA45R3C8_9PSEU|nr:Malonyl CoA-acyl carrier protein transacylase [Actinosynnema pretiosum subsp. pretiosum]QUF03722.1 acyltransferase domain-containing protein [Actinosynnema pretiosum subsp. pretiosum]